MSEQERRQSAEIQRDIANDVAIGESIKRDIAEQKANDAAYQRDVAQQQADINAYQRTIAEQRAFEAQVKADDARRMTRNVAASSAMAAEAANAAQRSSFATGLIALFVVVGLLLGGVVLYNNYKVKNDQLYSASVNDERNRTENQMLRETANREALRADAARQAAAAAAAQPTPQVNIRVTAPTPAPAPPTDVHVILPPPTTVDTPGPDQSTPAPDITPSTTENTNNDGSNTITVTTEPNH